MTRRPRLPRPRSRAMLVDVPVSSMKTSFDGSSELCPAFQAIRASATSGRSCSAACAVFFEADALGGKEPPYRPVADLHPGPAPPPPPHLQRQIGPRLDPLQQPGPILPFQARAALATHRLGGQA